MVQIARLRELANHLIAGQLHHNKFNFGILSMKYETCGSVGCAMGELPQIFPDDFEYDFECKATDTIVSKVMHKKSEITDVGVAKFFQISDKAFYHLFYPKSQKKQWGKTLDYDATKEEVAENILKYCNKVEKDRKNYQDLLSGRK